MAKEVETRWQRLKSKARGWLATYANRLATMLIISAAFSGIASILVDHDNSVKLVATAMLGVVLAYLFYLVAAFAHPHDHHHRFRHVIYQSAAFIVLALSLRAFSLHEAVTEVRDSIIGAATHGGAAGAPMNAGSVGELAAVMILFILVEVAAFVAQDVDEARTHVKEAGAEVRDIAKTVAVSALEMKNAAEGLDRVIYQIALPHLDPSVLKEAIALTRLWSDRAPNLGETSPDVSQRCWRILLKTYLQEEQHDFCPSRRDHSRRLEGIPHCVLPVGDITEKDVSYFATNVGFYVKFLAALVHELQTTKQENEKVCIAVVTNVLPAHWWNWTFAADEWRAYTAIEDLRRSMLDIAEGGAQVDRVIAVAPAAAPDPDGRNHLGLWPERLLRDMLSDWQILADRDKGEETVSCSTNFQEHRGEIGTKAFSSFPQALQKGALSNVPGARIYPMVTGQSLPTYSTKNYRWTPKPLRDEYEKLQGAGGKCWSLMVNSQVERKLDGHFDVMFIGLGSKNTDTEDKGIWGTRDVKWGVCLMNSYDAAVETMFLSVISDQSASKQFAWWQEQLKDEVDWASVLLEAPGK